MVQKLSSKPFISNIDRFLIFYRHIMVNGVESGRKIKDEKTWQRVWSIGIDEMNMDTVGLFQLSDACSRQTGEDCEDHWRQGFAYNW